MVFEVRTNLLIDGLVSFQNGKGILSFNNNEFCFEILDPGSTTGYTNVLCAGLSGISSSKPPSFSPSFIISSTST